MTEKVTDRPKMSPQEKGKLYGFGSKGHPYQPKRDHREKVMAKGHYFGGSAGPDPVAAAKKSHEMNKGVSPKSGNNVFIKPHNQSFAAKIREITKDGWELIDAVYYIFKRSQELEKDELTLEAATWLADRGFGKPVQVTQLTDNEGQPVAFTLWSPVDHDGEEIPQRRDMRDETDIVDITPLLIQPPPETPDPPTPIRDLEPTENGYERGIAQDWGRNDAERMTD